MAPIPFAYGLGRGTSRPPFSSSLGREVRVDGRWNRGRQRTSALPLFRGDPLRVVARLAFVPLNDAFFLHIVLCPRPVGLSVVERAVAGHARSLIYNGKWQDISAQGARNLRRALSKTL